MDVRILAATNRDLKAAMAAGSFRRDLFYRLNVFPIQVPSLRERTSDIPLLVEYYSRRYAAKVGKPFRNASPATLALFQRYDWPGDIRELQNVVERAVILSEGDVFTLEEDWFVPEVSPIENINTFTALALQQREMIEAALTVSRGKVAGPDGAAAKLGILDKRSIRKSSISASTSAASSLSRAPTNKRIGGRHLSPPLPYKVRQVEFRDRVVASSVHLSKPFCGTRHP